MVSDQEIASCVESFLSSLSAAEAGASSTGEVSFASVLRHAEAKLGTDLSRKASFIKDQIDLLTGPRRTPLHPSHVPAAPTPAHQAVQVQVQVPMPRQPAHVVQQPLQVTLPHPPPPAHLLFQPIPGVQLINVGGTGTMAHMQMGQVPIQAGGGEGQVGQVPVAFYPPPPLAYRFGTYQALSSQQAVMMSQQAGSQAGGSQSTDASKESPTAGTKRKRGGPGGLNKVCGVSPELQKIVGEASMSRTQIVKMLWGYIRQNNLQDPEDKRKIICNDQLKCLFDTDSTDMFKMNKLLSKHITPLDSLEMETRKRRAAELRAAKNNEESNQPESSDPNLNSNLNSVLISDKLAFFMGKEDREMSREDALNCIWDYVKTNQLEDNTHTTILCDAKLKDLFGCEIVPLSAVSDMLAQHFVAES